ncbi:pyrroline-5-carboxylate reductase [uncultured Pseudoflavonifractor sp.]|uniref:pyrroline-5-carboxylate reductase n=1 Tax=uncultured Pseudoflavonifractor sp. TaxID=1221379 RepID=UPI0025CCFA37|nr:pyrroline-5-carboxylate reductase [uncultured Pseudoflavonifractor sp.]
MKLGFIGAGNMSGAILDGVLKGGLLQADQIWISNRHEDKLERFARLGVHTTTDNCQAARETDLVILGVKPQMFGEVLPEIAEQVKGKGVLSISPGYSLAWLREQLPGCHVMRAMPNTPLLVGKGCTALAERGDAPETLFDAVKAVFSSAGEVFVVPENLIDAVIAIAGSSPAYFFRMADAMVRAGQAQGLEPEQALRMAALTMEGSARMLLESGKTAGELERQVCSPGGTTLAALTAFDDYRFGEMVSEAMERCVRRSRELGK